MKQSFSEKLLMNLDNFSQFDQLLSFWYEEFETPILVMNATFSKITSIGCKAVADEIPWMETYLDTGSLPREPIEEFAKEAINGMEPIIQHVPGSDKVIIAGNVSMRTERLLLVAFGSSDNIKALWENFRKILQAADIICVSSEHYLDNREIFLRDIIDNKIETEEQAVIRAKKLSITVKKNKPVCLLVGRFIENNRKVRKELCETITGVIFPNSCALDRGTYIAVLVFDHTQVMRGTQSLTKAENFFKTNKVQFCICPPAHKFSVVTGQAKEAVDILEMLADARNGKPIVFFEQSVFEYILKQKNSDELEMLCIPYVRKMYEKDIEMGTDNTLMLCAYLLCYGNCSEIAELMDKSYNTAKSHTTEFDKLIGDKFNVYAASLFYSIKILGVLYPEFSEKCEKIGSRLRDIKR